MVCLGGIGPVFWITGSVVSLVFAGGVVMEIASELRELQRDDKVMDDEVIKGVRVVEALYPKCSGIGSTGKV